MNFYTLAAKMNRSIRKRSANLHDMFNTSDQPEHHCTYEEALERAKHEAMVEFEMNCKLGIELMVKFKELASDKGLYKDRIKQWYFITIRPDTKAININAFMDKVMTFVNRKCFIAYEASFEQKGTTDDTLGDGFHVHMIANMSQRSKGEVLRDTISSFKDCTSANCIQVDILKSIDDLKRVREYYTEYESDDGHKILTQESDKLWRERLGIAPIYSKGALPNYQVQCSAGNSENYNNSD